MFRTMFIILRYLYHTLRYFTISILYPNLLHLLVRFVNYLRRNCAKAFFFYCCIIFIPVIILIIMRWTY